MLLRLPIFFLHAVEDIQRRWVRKLRAKRFDDVKEALLIKQQPRARIIQHESQFLGSQPNIEGQQHSARLDHAVVGFEEAMTVGAEKRDAVAGLDSRLSQGAGQPAGPLGELGVGEPFFSTDNGGALRILLLRVTKEADGRQRYIHGLSSRLRLSALRQPRVRVRLHNSRRPRPGRRPLLSNRLRRRIVPGELS